MPSTRDYSLAELRQMLRENEQAVGPDDPSTRLLRRIVEKRERDLEQKESQGGDNE